MKQTKKFVLVQYQDNWADEMDVYGFVLWETSKWKAYKQSVQVYFESHGYYEFSFGTNESIEYDSYEEFMKCFRVTPLTDMEYKTIRSAFGNKEFGVVFTNFDELNEEEEW